MTKTGYYDRSYKVTVIAGQTYTCPTWPLELVPTSGANADFSPFGGMDIRTDPEGADIWIHKMGMPHPAANQGMSPALLYLEPGDYEVYLTKDGYQQSATQTVKVERLYPEREPVRVEFTLTPLSPTFISISPSFGPTTGSTAVTVTGTNFVDGGSLSVTIGGVAATEVSVIDSTGIAATTPSGTSWTPGRCGYQRGWPDRTGTGIYTYEVPPTPAPTLTSISPATGSTAGGTSVTISGTGFTGATAVTFGGGAATFTVKSATQITAITPAHADRDRKRCCNYTRRHRNRYQQIYLCDFRSDVDKHLSGIRFDSGRYQCNDFWNGLYRCDCSNLWWYSGNVHG